MSQSEIDLLELQPLLERIGTSGRTMLLPALLEIQSMFGYIPREAASAVAGALHVPLAEVYGVIEFYSMLAQQPTARTVLRFCDSPVCRMSGGEEALHEVGKKLGVEVGQPDAGGTYMLERVPCLGMCEHAPVALVSTRPLGKVDTLDVDALLQGAGQPPQGLFNGSERWLTTRCGRMQPTDLEAFLSTGGFAGLRRALEMAPGQVIAEVKASGLVGRGGAAFPTGLKLEGVARAPAEPKYLVLNADESEPGTFKDRVLLEEDPFSVLEGMLIAAYASGASRGYAYVRGEYPRARQVLGQAIAELEKAGYLGAHILGSGFSFTIELRSGAGAYICGEETALFESIEGKRGFPRIKPPFPTTHGLFGKPTVINNVETFCNLPLILSWGVERYRLLGTERSPGPKLFCLSGDVQRPGLYELPFGVTMRELIFEHAGGMRAAEELQAVLLGGAAGSFVAPHDLDVRLTFEDLRTAGLSLGSGALMVFDSSRDLRQVLLELAHFFAHESCGKCYPCQLGTQRQVEILDRLAGSAFLPGDLERLLDVGWTMNDASLCGLGQTAAMAVLSAHQKFPGLFVSNR